MSKLESLIAELCADGVTYKAVDEICSISKGVQFNKSDMNQEGTYPVINGGINPSGYAEVYNQQENTITISQGGASAGYVNWITTKFWAGAHCYILKPTDEVNNRYLYHFIKSKEYVLQECQYGAGIPALAKSAIAKLLIPVPHILVQNEIVRILDTFSSLTAELQAELQARKEQYNEYINILINEKIENQKVIPLGQLFDFRNGLSKGKEYFGSGIPFIRYTDVYNNRFLRESDITALVECTENEIEKLRVSRGDVLFTRTSETAEDVGWSSVMLDDIGDCVFNGFTIKASPKTDLLLPEYCAYCFSVYSFREYVTTHCAFTTRASLTGKTIAEYELSVPSIETQEKIVSFLDKLYLLCNDISEGIPAEIEARQKQYVYYRDKLLSFENLG